MNTSQVCWLEAHRNDLKSRIPICFEVFPLPPTTRTCWLRTLTFTCLHSDANIICWCFERTRNIFDIIFPVRFTAKRLPRANPSIDCPSLIIFGTIAVTDGMQVGSSPSFFIIYSRFPQPRKTQREARSFCFHKYLLLASHSPPHLRERSLRNRESTRTLSCEWRFRLSLPPSPSCFIVD